MLGHYLYSNSTFNIENPLKLNDNYGVVVWVWPSLYVHVFELLVLTSGTVLEDCGTLGGRVSVKEANHWKRALRLQRLASLATLSLLSEWGHNVSSHLTLWPLFLLCHDEIVSFFKWRSKINLFFLLHCFCQVF